MLVPGTLTNIKPHCIIQFHRCIVFLKEAPGRDMSCMGHCPLYTPGHKSRLVKGPSRQEGWPCSNFNCAQWQQHLGLSAVLVSVLFWQPSLLSLPHPQNQKHFHENLSWGEQGWVAVRSILCNLGTTQYKCLIYFSSIIQKALMGNSHSWALLAELN